MKKGDRRFSEVNQQTAQSKNDQRQLPRTTGVITRHMHLPPHNRGRRRPSGRSSGQWEPAFLRGGFQHGIGVGLECRVRRESQCSWYVHHPFSPSPPARNPFGKISDPRIQGVGYTCPTPVSLIANGTGTARGPGALGSSDLRLGQDGAAHHLCDVLPLGSTSSMFTSRQPA